MAPEGCAPRVAAPIEAIEANPREAQIAMMQAHLFDLVQRAGSQEDGLNAQNFLPEMFLPLMQSAAATAPKAQPVATGSKRQREETTTFGNGLQTYDDVEVKKPRLGDGEFNAGQLDDGAGSYVRIGPWNFSTKVKEIKQTITGMFNSLPLSHLVRAPNTIIRCANRQFVIIPTKVPGEAETLIRAWGQRGPALAACKVVACPADEVPKTFPGNVF